ncbi:MAG: transglycosylase SLT domain-containing protein [Oscillochloridaceae bacterium]|nr:transglycosylase SLT domain-containing protein [Chloroflexaceae bacterium]MDW8390856.1 transglycosylase SLT domain-containing protein [Oscillochloridaceae bacterium]
MSRSTTILLSALLALSLGACEVVTAPFPDAPVSPASGTGAPEALPPAPVLLQRAMAARAIGDDAAAGADLSALLQRYPTVPEALAARYYLAESFARRGRWTSAAEMWRAFLTAAPAEHPLRPPALFWLARAHESAGDHAAAIAAYQEYRALDTSIAPYAALRQAAQEQALARHAEAAASYLIAARSAIPRGERAGAFEKAIVQLMAAGRPDEALALYPELLDLARQPAYRARVLTEAIALADSQGQTEQARRWRLEIVSSAPETPEAAIAMDQLLAAGAAEVRAAQAGRIYMAAGRWSDAVAQFERAIATEGDLATSIELRRLRGLALRAAGDMPGALAALAEAVALDPYSEPGRQARLDQVQTTGQAGNVEGAIQGYLEYAAAYPDDPRAPVALDRVVQLRERLGDAEGALQARLDLGRRYPGSAEGRVALHRAGLALYEAGRVEEARAAWQTLADHNDGGWRARGAFWAARTARDQGDAAAAEALFAAAIAAAPHSYEGVRAAEELGRQPAGALPIGAPIAAEAWSELEAWATTWAGAPAPPSGDERATRAAHLEQVGLQTEAMNEWREGLDEARGQPWALLRLARAAYEGGATYPALLAAEELAALAPAPDQAPPALRRLIFPTPYADLVNREATANGLDPRLLYALLRQESLFNPGATSWVGARGLAQVMPETGQGIAQSLGISDFTLDDLYRPVVSVRFGSYYLARRLADMEGSVQGALAAYNGGLGNAQRWAGGSRVADPDRFTEQIDFAETRGYVRAVYGFWGAYQELYAPPVRATKPVSKALW